MAEIVRASHVLTPEERSALEAEEDARPPAWLMTPFFGLFIALGATSLGVGVRTRSLFALIWGGLFGGIPLVMALIPFFNASLWMLLPLAVGLFALGYLKGATWVEKLSSIGSPPATDAAVGEGDDASAGTSRRGRTSGASSSRSPRPSSRGSGSSSSSSSSSSWSSGSSSSGSFGGGRSGGGGASGRW